MSNNINRHESVKAYFDSLSKEDIIYENGETLFEACKKIVAKEFGSEEDNSEAYLENLKDFAALMYCSQPWFTPAGNNVLL
ncbi:hypothetical protein N9A28_03515 [Sulfurimonas sp.]|nr:hypothetical protein [Sulfurimonas sp.]